MSRNTHLRKREHMRRDLSLLERYKSEADIETARNRALEANNQMAQMQAEGAKAIAEMKAEAARINEHYDAEAKRFRELTAGTSAPPPSPACCGA